MKFSNKILSQCITQLCLAKGIDTIVISPGSRNAPLTIGFTENPSFKNYSIVDERCAAFFALGIAQQSKKPVALVCSSGSALLNYFPAIAEAFYSDVPLIVISADRPEHLLEIGDGQTIQQENVYGKHILYNANCIDGEANYLSNEEKINSALNIALEQNGPVHINVPFSEPLYETVSQLQVNVTNIEIQEDAYPSFKLDSFIETWNHSKKKLVLVGTLAPDCVEQELLNELIKDESVIVLTETTSNLHHPHIINAIDQLIAPLGNSDFEDLKPEIVLTFGGMIISKKIKSFLRNYPPAHHWHIDAKKAYDTFFKLNHHFRVNVNHFLSDFLPRTNSISSVYKSQWLNIKNHREEKHKQYQDSIPYSDFNAFSEIFKSIPTNYQLQLSNSATVRYSQLFTLDSTISVFCNRGTSGIDGSTSTAIGAAVASEKPTLFITGDLSFLYDSNALWNQNIPSTFKIIVINNSGGGIFRILPGEKDTKSFDTYFETKHELTAAHLCEMYGLKYSSISDGQQLKSTINTFFQKNDSPSLLEIFTPNSINDTVLLDYFKFIK